MTKKKKTQKVSLGSKGSFTVHKGGLHRALGIPEGQKIPASRLASKPGDSSHLKHMKASAKGFKAMSHGKMHTGGTIPESGMYEMEKGEHVTPAAKSMSGHWEIDGASRKWVPEGGKCSC
jgi:hypothetical protein